LALQALQNWTRFALVAGGVLGWNFGAWARELAAAWGPGRGLPGRWGPPGGAAGPPGAWRGAPGPRGRHPPAPPGPRHPRPPGRPGGVRSRGQATGARRRGRLVGGAPRAARPRPGVGAGADRCIRLPQRPPAQAVPGRAAGNAGSENVYNLRRGGELAWQQG